MRINPAPSAQSAKLFTLSNNPMITQELAMLAKKLLTNVASHHRGVALEVMCSVLEREQYQSGMTSWKLTEQLHTETISLITELAAQRVWRSCRLVALCFRFRGYTLPLMQQDQLQTAPPGNRSPGSWPWWLWRRIASASTAFLLLLRGRLLSGDDSIGGTPCINRLVPILTDTW